MSDHKISVFKLSLYLALLPLLFVANLCAQTNRTIHGTVADPVGKFVSDATVLIQQGDKAAGQTKTLTDGSFELSVPADNLYNVRVVATGFEPQTVAIASKNGNVTDLSITLYIGTLQQEVVVSATGAATPITQVGASVTLLDSELITALNKLDVLENLRNVPGVQVVQTNQRGGTTSLFIRGGDSDFNKVIVDGITVNGIGGTFDFSQLSNAGIDSVEVMRGANSVLYGSDALAGVVTVTSKRGLTTIPQLKLSADGGNFGTFNRAASFSGVVSNFDYYSQYARYDTEGSEPNSAFHNATVSGNFGWQPNEKTGVRATFKRITTDVGTPNALLFYGIADNSSQNNKNLYTGITAQNQTTERWHNLLRFAYGQFGEQFINPSPTGQPFTSDEPFVGTNYIGNLVTIRGANGYSVTGRGILDFGGIYPQIFNSYEARRSIYAQTDYQFFGDWTGIAGFRYEHENGEQITRDNYSSFLETHGSIAHRLFVTAGVGLESNGFFGFAAIPRVSVAYYLRQPSSSGFFSDTKLKFNFGKGIEEAQTFQQASSLIDLLTPEQVAEFHVAPIGPQRSRTTDVGIEQGLWKGRASIGATFFYNNFYDLISFLDVDQLIAIGVPPDVAQSTPIGGAYVNASSERALGTELEGRINLGRGLTFQGQYTYLDAVTTKSFGFASFNPSFPDIPIGAFASLVGARPFHRAPHSGSLILMYNRRNFNAAFNGSLVSRRDDSTFLSDENEGNTLLLPNRNVAPGYEKFDLSGSYTFTSWVKAYTSIENLFSQHYQAAFGFPGTPFTIRSGLTFTIGGHDGNSK
jgi:vitamin B12 transporter